MPFSCQRIAVATVLAKRPFESAGFEPAMPHFFLPSAANWPTENLPEWSDSPRGVERFAPGGVERFAPLSGEPYGWDRPLPRQFKIACKRPAGPAVSAQPRLA